jgi:hypothetical protein
MPLRSLAFLLLCLLPAGCRGTAWANYYKENPKWKGTTFPPSIECSVRHVEIERLDKYESERKERRSQSDVAWEDLPEADKQVEKNALLETLRVKERGDEAAILGITSFVTDQTEDPTGGVLERFGKQIGADYAIFSTKTLGEAEHRRVPETTYSSAYANGNSRESASVMSGNGYAWGSGDLRKRECLRFQHDVEDDPGSGATTRLRRLLHPPDAAERSNTPGQ